MPHDGDVPWQIHWYGALLHETSPIGRVVVDVVVVVVVVVGKDVVVDTQLPLTTVPDEHVQRFD